MNAEPVVRLADNVANMELEHAGRALGKVLLQGFPHHRKGQLLPGNFLLGEQLDFQAFRARLATPSLIWPRNIKYTWLTCSSEYKPYRVGFSTTALASSHASRTAATTADSPFSMKPAGNVHRP